MQRCFFSGDSHKGSHILKHHFLLLYIYKTSSASEEKEMTPNLSTLIKLFNFGSNNIGF